MPLVPHVFLNCAKIESSFSNMCVEKRSPYQIIIGNLKIRFQHCLLNMFDLLAFLSNDNLFFIKVVCLSSFIIIAVAEHGFYESRIW